MEKRTDKNEIKKCLKSIINNQIKNCKVCKSKTTNDIDLHYYLGRIDGYEDVLKAIETVLI